MTDSTTGELEPQAEPQPEIGRRAHAGRFVGKARDDIAKVQKAEIGKYLAETYFAWMGGTAAESAFYCRIQSPVIWIEVDCQSPFAFGSPYGETNGGPRRSGICTAWSPHTQRQRLRQGAPAPAPPDVAAPPLTADVSQQRRTRPFTSGPYGATFRHR
ncbi:DUF3500 domain-containing protein [Streptomyces sp. SLBN-115]|uniref:DUF3500 domain-containing protein n=1 Tax=Streptomyces sp. SLBN-115 TaxID=2768453 RepID=UPI00116DBA51|nr:DUF3500 domain-containing protein [Streptomyces sp. SLBN-115]TQJ56334.1 uncharacterized protein DUF3500 [Streptomyces sp. SLBN-115]